MTALAMLVGAVLGVAFGLVVLAGCGLLYMRGMEAIGRQDGGRDGCRRSAGTFAQCSRPAEPDRDALARMVRAGWIETDTIRGSDT